MALAPGYGPEAFKAAQDAIDRCVPRRRSADDAYGDARPVPATPVPALIARLGRVQAVADQIELNAALLDNALIRLGAPNPVPQEPGDGEAESPNSETALGRLDTQIGRLESLAAWLGESAERLERVV